MAQSGYNISDLFKEAHNRWLKPAEVLFILQNYEEDQLSHELAKTPPASGSLFLYNKRVLRFFRRDGHSWRKKKDGKTVGEAHERLKAGNIEALNCYYAHGEQNPNFQRRSYWMLDPAYEHIVLVHYRDIIEGRQSSGSNTQFSSGTSVSLGQSSNSYIHPGSSSTISGLYESNQSPQSVEFEFASDVEMKSNRLERSLGIRRESSGLELSKNLHRIEVQLSLNDETLEDPHYYDCQDPADLEHAWKDHSESSNSVHDANDFLMLQNSGNNAQYHHHGFAPELTPDHKDQLFWNEMLDFSKSSVDVNSQENNLLTLIENEKEFLPTRSLVEKEADQWTNLEGSTSYNDNDVTNCDVHTTLQYAVSSQTTASFDNNLVFPTSRFISHDVENFNLPAYNSIQTMDDYNETFNQDQSGIHLEADQFSISHKQNCTIREVSPEWGYAFETTKVVIVGSFLCDSPIYACKFGDTEVPVEVIQAGVICCLAPPLSPGKVTFSITCGNQESCSEVRLFEFRSKESSSLEDASSKSPEELLLLVRLVQMLLIEGYSSKGDTDSNEPGSDLMGKLKVGEDSWDQVMGAVLDGSWTSSSTIAWLLQELLKDKLQKWLCTRSGGCEQFDSLLSKKEQGMLHLVAALGFEWALNPILNSGVNIDFRDINGWTALHWAARFGREKMVAALVAKGASAGVVTDPNGQDPDGKTPAKIASSNGHKGLAGYLSEIALTSHLSSLTLEEDDDSEISAKMEAGIRVNDIAQRSLNGVDHHSLAAVWNASQAATRIQAAFRAHSFRQRQQRVAAASSPGIIDEYDIFSGNIEGLSAASKSAFGKARNHNTAALSIQKNYRGSKVRKNYLAFRQKVVMIQAHVRGRQVRAQYKVVCWAVGIMEKAVIRWRRKGIGLRGYRPELESIAETEDEDILKVFRKKKVDGNVKDALKRVLSMVEHPEARQQYCRMLVKHQEATQAENEAEFQDIDSEINMINENDDPYQYIML
ncbi:calmodulin-binding transcription activator 4 isoform X2 [Impatiens glandulifera]|uniref:calmodulin-binding transcription activator 4 isoform X2 n=1 Tax=Impatiens glandulifera TaxID=253017 RepID=UPI001FB13C4C|nr:calmodulin-binding transcription activator 4 isoform X2 [Impatiens glandulifera]